VIGALLMAAALAADPTPAVGAVDSLPRRVTLAEVRELASHDALAVIQAEGQLRVSRAAVTAARAAFIPNVTLSATSSRQLPVHSGQTTVQNGQLVTLAPAPWSIGTSLGANVTLFNGGQRIATLQQADAQASQADANLVTQRFAAMLAAEQQYFDVLAGLESESAAQASLAQARQQLVISKLKLSQRTVTRSDSLRSEIAVHNAELSLVQATTARIAAEAALTRALGSVVPLTATPGDTSGVGPLPVPDDSLRALATHGPAVADAEAALKAAEATLRGAWGTWLPSLSASYTRSGNGSSHDFDIGPDGMIYNGSLRFSLSLPLFEQWQRMQQMTQARVARDEAAATLRDARLGAVASLTQILATYRAAEQRVDTQTATVEAAEEDLRVQKDKYDVGSSTLLDVLTSESALDQGRHDLIQARYDLRVARAQLEALVGRSL